MSRRDNLQEVERSPNGQYIRFDMKVGSGAYKEVWLAFDTESGREVAWNTVDLRRVPGGDQKRIKSETEILRQLKHPHIINFYDVWTNPEKEQICFTTEIVTSGTLKQYINRVQRVKLKVIKRWCRQILDGLNYLHRHLPPIIHRDLKCDNIFINGSTGEIRIGDFGLSAAKNKTHAESVLGTPEFMAPELYDESYTEKVDIYAFGMCVLEMTTNEYPYQECANPAQVWKKVAAGVKPEVLSRIGDHRVRAFIDLCLSSEDWRLSAEELLRHPFLQDFADARDNACVCVVNAETSKAEAKAAKAAAKDPTASSGRPRSNVPVTVISVKKPEPSAPTQSKKEPADSPRKDVAPSRSPSVGHEAAPAPSPMNPRPPNPSPVQLRPSSDSAPNRFADHVVVSIHPSGEADCLEIMLQVLYTDNYKKQVSFQFHLKEDTIETVAQEMVMDVGFPDAERAQAMIIHDFRAEVDKYLREVENGTLNTNNAFHLALPEHVIPFQTNTAKSRAAVTPRPKTLTSGVIVSPLVSALPGPVVPLPELQSQDRSHEQLHDERQTMDRTPVQEPRPAQEQRPAAEQRPRLDPLGAPRPHSPFKPLQPSSQRPKASSPVMSPITESSSGVPNSMQPQGLNVASLRPSVTVSTRTGPHEHEPLSANSFEGEIHRAGAISPSSVPSIGSVPSTNEIRDFFSAFPVDALKSHLSKLGGNPQGLNEKAELIGAILSLIRSHPHGTSMLASLQQYHQALMVSPTITDNHSSRSTSPSLQGSISPPRSSLSPPSRQFQDSHAPSYPPSIMFSDRKVTSSFSKHVDDRHLHQADSEEMLERSLVEGAPGDDDALAEYHPEMGDVQYDRDGRLLGPPVPEPVSLRAVSKDPRRPSHRISASDIPQLARQGQMDRRSSLRNLVGSRTLPESFHDSRSIDAGRYPIAMPYRASLVSKHGGTRVSSEYQHKQSQKSIVDLADLLGQFDDEPEPWADENERGELRSLKDQFEQEKTELERTLLAEEDAINRLEDELVRLKLHLVQHRKDFANLQLRYRSDYAQTKLLQDHRRRHADDGRSRDKAHRASVHSLPVSRDNSYTGLSLLSRAADPNDHGYFHSLGYDPSTLAPPSRVVRGSSNASLPISSSPPPNSGDMSSMNGLSPLPPLLHNLAPPGSFSNSVSGTAPSSSNYAHMLSGSMSSAYHHSASTNSIAHHVAQHAPNHTSHAVSSGKVAHPNGTAAGGGPGGVGSGGASKIAKVPSLPNLNGSIRPSAGTPYSHGTSASMSMSGAQPGTQNVAPAHNPMGTLEAEKLYKLQELYYRDHHHPDRMFAGTENQG